MTHTNEGPAGLPAARLNWALWALFAGNFIIGTGILLPAGMLNDLSAGLGVSPATAGLLMLASGIVIGLGAPFFATFTSGIDRRVLLVGSLIFYAAGHALSALAPDFWSLLALRAITVISAGIFTPQAAASVGLIVPPEKRAGAVAFIFIGWSIASVAGMPCGSLIAAFIGWRFAYAIMALLALAAGIIVWRTMPSGLHVGKLSLAAWRDVFFDPVLILILLVTLASSSGQFTAFSYMAPLFKDLLGASPALIAGLLAGFGAAGVLGNFIAARFVARIGIDRMILLALGALLIGMIVFSATLGLLAGAAVAMAIWGLGTFSSNSLQQSRLIAHAPALASASVALNTSTIYLGQAIGAGVGAKIVAEHLLAWLTPVGSLFAALAIVFTLIASRFDRRRG
ncbi:MFS transporter [Taklimakanibacter lacteus]|uniref:MFS transporter n=1 Tax=Taklimakanibacter lacteus TaxID=2268456 RepID=UPI000E66E962